MALTRRRPARDGALHLRRSDATAQEAIRARAESARDVSTTGTRAPSTMPAPSALAK